MYILGVATIAATTAFVGTIVGLTAQGILKSIIMGGDINGYAKY